ncbi:MAG TPA: DUF4292 domain-containing protein [Puia sp.]|nr:DUF4292 domain-containing protein [Puia sp.]
MKTLKLGLLSLIGLLSMQLVQAQTADEIITKHIDAIGGKDKINAVKTITLESTLEVMGNEAPSSTIIVNGKGYKSETDFNGQKIINVITDNGGWMLNPMMGQTSPEALPAEQAKAGRAQLQIGGPLFDYAAKGNKVELQGKENVGTVNAYKIKVTTKDSAESTYYIDPTTYYILKAVNKSIAPGQEGETSVTFSNYQKTEMGYVFPMAQEITLPQGITLSITHKKIEINKDVDPKVFDMPKS